LRVRIIFGAARVGLVLLLLASPLLADSKPIREIRTDPGDTHQTMASDSVPLRPELLLPGDDIEIARFRVEHALNELGLQVTPYADSLWLESSVPPPSPYRFSDGIVLYSNGIPHGRTNRRIRVELVPLNNRDEIAIKIWEACDPSLAPEGAARTWHPCGGALSRPYKAAVQQLREELSPRDGIDTEDPD